MSLTNDEKIALLTQAGVSVDDAQASVLGAPPEVIDEQPDEDILGPVDIPAMLAQAVESDLDKACKRIVGKAYADKAKALALCESEGKEWFDKRKFSKVQAAAAGVDRSAHNKALWAEAQAMVTTLKRMVRDHYRVNSVKAKIAESKKALPQEVRDLSDDALERLLASEAFLALARKEQG